MKMSMERRALVAFVASMVLFLAYDALYLGPRMKAQRARREAAALAEASHDSASIRTDTPGTTHVPTAPGSPAGRDTLGLRAETGAFAAVDTTNAATIIVASPLYEIALTTHGGEVVSVKLLKFLTDGRPVSLLPAGKSWSGERMLAASLRGEHDALSLSDVMFEASAGGGALADGARVDVTGDKPTDVVFRAVGPTGSIERTYRFYGDRYDFETGVRAGESVLPGATGVAWSMGPGLVGTEKNVRDDQSAFHASVSLGEEFHRKRPGDFGHEHVEKLSGTFNWASLQTKYFLAALFPTGPTRADVEISGARATHNISERVTLPSENTHGEITRSVRVFLGPIDYHRLKDLGVGLEKSVNFGWQWIRPVCTAVLWSMTTLYKVIPNYGLVIIIISILAKVLFYRLTHKSFKSMKQMQDLQPRLQALKEKFGSDKRRLSEETMKLYKEAGVNPLGGCLPILLQMPVFIALYNVLRFNIALRGAPFVGWINDLSQQDVLFKLPFTLPLIGGDFSLLPIIMGGAMFAQSKLGGSPTGSTSPMPPGYTTMLPIVFTVLFYKMPAGLVIYWIINTAISVVQQYYIVKDTRGSHPALVAEAPRQRSRGKKS